MEFINLAINKSASTVCTLIADVVFFNSVFLYFMTVLATDLETLKGQLAVQKDISQHCVNQSGYIMTLSLDEKDHLFIDYLISRQFRWSHLKL